MLPPSAVPDVPCLRALTEADCDTVAELIRRAFAGHAVEPLPSALRVTAGAIRTHLAEGGGGVVADPALACLLWSQADGALHVSRVAVDPDSRRQGLAAAMLAMAEREARRRGLATLRLSTRLAFADNRRLFGRLGFVETTLHAHPGYAEPTFVDLEKSLAMSQALHRP